MLFNTVPSLLDALIATLVKLPEGQRLQWTVEIMRRVTEVQAQALAGVQAEDQAEAA